MKKITPRKPVKKPKKKILVDTNKKKIREEFKQQNYMPSAFGIGVG